MKVYELLESFHEEPEIPDESKIVLKDRIERYSARIKDFVLHKLIKPVTIDDDSIKDEDILPGEHYAFVTNNPVTRDKITDIFNRLQKSKARFKALKLSNPVLQFKHTEDVINQKGGWGGDETDESKLVNALRDLVKKGLVLPKTLVPKNKRPAMYDAGQLDKKDITHYYVPPGPNQSKIIKYVEWWRTEKAKIDNELADLRKEREKVRGKAERYKSKAVTGGDKATALTNPRLALQYALVHGPDPDIEDVVSQYQDQGIEYAAKVLKGRFPAFESCYSAHPAVLIRYAIAINERVPAAEALLKKSAAGFTYGYYYELLKQYENHFGVTL